MEKVLVSDVMWLNLDSSYVNLHLVTENWRPLPLFAKDNKLGMGTKHPFYHDLARATINLALPWHSVAEEIADLNFKIVTGQLNKTYEILP